MPWTAQVHSLFGKLSRHFRVLPCLHIVTIIKPCLGSHCLGCITEEVQHIARGDLISEIMRARGVS